MGSPIEFPDVTLILPPRLFGSIGYYARLCRYGSVIIDPTIRYDKRAKAVHRYDIADVRGPVSLTVPVTKPLIDYEEDDDDGPRPTPNWCHCAVSRHGDWWRKQLTALESAYGRTPYFEFIIDRFSCIFRDPWDWGAPSPNVMWFDAVADRIVREILALDNDVEWESPDVIAPGTPTVDLRRASFTLDATPPYWQIRADRLGFIPNLSILDLIFNLGPEAPLYLTQLTIDQSL